MRKTFDDVVKEIMGENIMAPTAGSNKQPVPQQNNEQPAQAPSSATQQPPAANNNQQGDEEELFKVIQQKMNDQAFNSEKFMELLKSLQQQTPTA